MSACLTGCAVLWKDSIGIPGDKAMALLAGRLPFPCRAWSMTAFKARLNPWRAWVQVGSSRGGAAGAGDEEEEGGMAAAGAARGRLVGAMAKKHLVQARVCS